MRGVLFWEGFLVPEGKVYSSAVEALEDVFDGAVIMLGGFGVAGLPQSLVKALMELGPKDLTTISNTCFEPKPDEYDVARLVERGQVRKVITTFFGRPNQEIPALELWREGKLEVEVIPQGVLAERMRAAGAGLGGVYVPNYVGTVFEESEVREFEGKEYVLASPLRADFALIGGHQSDRLGNLTYRFAQRNYNPVMASAAKVTVAEVREVVEVGSIDPERVVTPGIYVDRIVVGGHCMTASLAEFGVD